MRPLVLLSSLQPGGAERVTVSTLRRLAARGHPVPLCTVESRHDGPLADEVRAAGIPRFDLGAARLADPRALVRFVRLLRREHVDVVHAHGQDASILAAVAQVLAPARLVITRHVIEEPSRSWREAARALAALWAARRADALVAVSSAAATSWAALARVPEARVRVIPNGIEVERFDRADLAARRGALRAGLGLTERDDAILVLAVLREGKGHEVLLRALTTLRGSRPTARLLVAGAGEREAELRRLASPLGDAVAFLGHREDTPELLAAADVVALPSFAEALPTALVEAAAAGKPAVATRVGGTPDVVVDGVTGWLVPPRDADALARALGQALADPARAAAMGEAARARARERFTLDAQVDATLRLWQEVAAQRPH